MYNVFCNTADGMDWQLLGMAWIIWGISWGWPGNPKLKNHLKIIANMATQMAEYWALLS